MPSFIFLVLYPVLDPLLALFYVLGGIESFSASRPFSRKHFIIGNHPEVRTGRADIVQNLVGTDLRVNSLDRSGHGEGRKAEDMLERRGGEN